MSVSIFPARLVYSILTCLLMTSSVSSPLLAAEVVTLQVYPTIQWAKKTMPIHMIAKVYGKRKIKGEVDPIPVDLSPLIGESGKPVKVGLLSLEKILSESLSKKGYVARIVGPISVLLKQRARSVDSTKIIGFAHGELEGVISPHFDRIILIPVVKSVTGVVLEEGDQLKLDTRDYLSKISSRMTVAVEVVRKGTAIARVPIGFSLRVFKKVPVLANDVLPMTPVLAGDITRRMVDITAFVDRVVQELPSQGVLAKRSLREGETLKHNDLLPMPDVIKGHTVKVITRVGTVTIESEAIALSHGYIGDNIDAKNASNDEVFTAKVTANRRLSAIGDR